MQRRKPMPIGSEDSKEFRAIRRCLLPEAGLAGERAVVREWRCEERNDTGRYRFTKKAIC